MGEPEDREAAQREPDSGDRTDSLKARIAEYERWVRLLDGQIRLLERERQKLAAIVNHADAGFLVFDSSLRVVWANDFCGNRLRSGAAPANVAGAPCNRVLCGLDEICSSCPAALSFQTRSVAHHEVALDVEGHVRHLYATAMPILSPIGTVDQAMVMVQDVSGLEVLRRSEEALRESEGRLRLLMEQMPAVMWSTDVDLRVTSSVGAALAGLSLRPNELVGKTLYEYFGTTDPDFPSLDAHLRAVAGESLSFETVWAGRSFQAHVDALRDSSGKIIGSVGAAFDVTERKQAEEAKRDSDARKGAVMRTALDAIVAIDQDGRVTEFNPAAEAMFGYGRDEVLGKDMGELIVPPALREKHAAGMKRYLQSGRSDMLGRRVEMSALRRDGTEFPVEIAVTRVPIDGPPSFMGYVRDLSDRKRAETALREREEQLRQSQRLEAVGTLAGGIAHDFNNLLTCILGYAELVRKDAKPGDKNHRAADFIEKAARRGADLTQQLLGFARKGKNQEIPVELNAMIAEVIGLLSRTIDKNIRIVCRPEAERLFTSGDPGQLQQMLLNLALNARDAMPDGGELTFSAEISVVTPQEAAARLGMVPGRYVVLSVRDTGCGIPEEVRGRIFEPFFTTKEQGKGTGMGLAMSYGIVKSHGGFIYADSQVGRGTTLRVYLPLREVPAEREDDAPGAAARNGMGRILVVDDEEMVRSLAADYLSDLGYEVITAEDGQQAVERFADLKGEIDLVLVDLVMPRMGGRDCYRALKKMNPEVKTILSTGYGSNTLAQELLDEGMLGFIPKPYELLHLAEVVSRVLKR
jgi:PAS domain S-box-containing protein